jgi:hypothetical protein
MKQIERERRRRSHRLVSREKKAKKKTNGLKLESFI